MSAANANLAVPLIHSHTVSAERGSAALIDQYADEWRELCAQSEGDEPFYRPEWIRAYLRAFAPAAKVLVITVRHEGRLEFVLPLVEEISTFKGVPVRKLRAPANCHPGRFDFVCQGGPMGEAAIRSAWVHLRSLKGWDLLELLNVPEGGACARLVLEAQASGFPAVCVPEHPHPYISLPDAVDALEAFPQNIRLRRKLRQIRRELTAEKLNFFCLEAPTCDILERFFELEASGWKGQEKSAINSAASTLAFYKEIAASAERFRYFALYMLEYEGELLAAHLSLIHRGRCYSPKVGFNEKFERLAAGHLILQEILRDCVARGVRVYDFAGIDEEWKLKWTSETLPINHHFVFKGPIGYMAYGAGVRLKSALRQILPRTTR